MFENSLLLIIHREQNCRSVSLCQLWCSMQSTILRFARYSLCICLPISYFRLFSFLFKNQFSNETHFIKGLIKRAEHIIAFIESHLTIFFNRIFAVVFSGNFFLVEFFYASELNDVLESSWVCVNKAKWKHCVNVVVFVCFHHKYELLWFIRTERLQSVYVFMYFKLKQATKWTCHKW